MGSPSRNVQYHPPRLSEDRLNLAQPHSPSLPTHCSGKSGMRPDEAGYVVLQIAGGIRAGQQQQIERQVLLVGRQPQQLVPGHRRGRQVRERVYGELPRRVDDVDALFQPLQGQGHRQRLQAGDGVDQAVDGPKRRRRHPYAIRAGGHLHAEAAVAIRRGLPNGLRGPVGEHAHGGGPHHAAGLVGNGAGYAGCRLPGSQRSLQSNRRLPAREHEAERRHGRNSHRYCLLTTRTTRLLHALCARQTAHEAGEDIEPARRHPLHAEPEGPPAGDRSGDR